jgi:hypothetical protein
VCEARLLMCLADLYTSVPWSCSRSSCPAGPRNMKFTGDNGRSSRTLGGNLLTSDMTSSGKWHSKVNCCRLGASLPTSTSMQACNPDSHELQQARVLWPSDTAQWAFAHMTSVLQGMQDEPMASMPRKRTPCTPGGAAAGARGLARRLARSADACSRSFDVTGAVPASAAPRCYSHRRRTPCGKQLCRCAAAPLRRQHAPARHALRGYGGLAPRTRSNSGSSEDHRKGGAQRL